jgi:hypothetical protein
VQLVCAFDVRDAWIKISSIFKMECKEYNGQQMKQKKESSAHRKGLRG